MVTFIKARSPCDSDSIDVRRLCFPMTPRLPPSPRLLAPLFPFSRSRPLLPPPLPPCFSSFSPCPFHALPFSTLCPPSLFFSLLRTFFCLPPFSFFRVLFRVKRWSEALRDPKFREIRGLGESHTWRRFSSARPLRALTVGYAPFFSLRAVLSFSFTCGVSR